jgi:hypothetical protein
MREIRKDPGLIEHGDQTPARMKRVTGAHTAALYERTGVFRIYEHNVICSASRAVRRACARPVCHNQRVRVSQRSPPRCCGR